MSVVYNVLLTSSYYYIETLEVDEKASQKVRVYEKVSQKAIVYWKVSQKTLCYQKILA